MYRVALCIYYHQNRAAIELATRAAGDEVPRPPSMANVQFNTYATGQNSENDLSEIDEDMSFDYSGFENISENDDVQGDLMEDDAEEWDSNSEQDAESETEEESVGPSTKRKKIDEVAAAAKEDLNETADDDQRCPICLEVWSNAGDHRLCALRCGHLFGLSCITRWFEVSNSANGKKCPECKAKAAKRDIRVLYAKQLLCLDTAENERLKDQIKTITVEKEKVEKQVKDFQMKEFLYKHEIANLKQKIEELQKEKRLISSDKDQISIHYKNFILKKTKVFDICSNNSCRVMAYNPWHKILIVSNGETISKIVLEDSFRTFTNKIHAGPIRDLAFQEQHPNILLSVGFDKKVVLTDMRANVLVHSYKDESNLWSCCWSNYNSQSFFVGGQRGTVIEYDIRNLQSEVSKRNGPDTSPVVSLAAVPTSSLALRAGGYLACHLNSFYAYSFKEGLYTEDKIEVDGPFISLRYDEKHNNVLLSCRASAKNPNVRHIVGELAKTDNEIKFNPVHSFNSGSAQKLLSRPCFTPLQNDTLVVTHNESLKSLVAHSISTGQEAYSLPMDESVVDICSFEFNGLNQAVLTSNKLHLYNHIDMS